MDIKDFILIGGGILIALVVGHGFWIAWRSKREPLRMDIVPDLIPDDMDDMERLRGELPNGGARVVSHRSAHPDQQNLELELAAPVLMDPAAASTPASNRVPAGEAVPTTSSTQANGSAAAKAAAPSSSGASPPPEKPNKAPFDRPKKLRARMHQASLPEVPRQEPIAAVVADKAETSSTSETSRLHVREVDLQPQIVSEAPIARRQETGGGRGGKRKHQREADNAEQKTSPESVPVEELIIINVLAARGQRFDGEGLVEALRKQGLRYGDMNIFHRVDAATKAKLYSVANAVEPGTFDLSDLSTMRSPGMTFFLQLPGPDHPTDVFNDMLQAARNVALDLGGELRDEQLSVLTGQTTEHMRQRIADFARRRLSKRA